MLNIEWCQSLLFSENENPLPFIVFANIALGFLIAFSFTWVVLRWVKVQKRIAYGIAGAIALVLIVYLMPLVFFGIDMLAGARTTVGKIILILCGYIGGHFFGTRLSKEQI